MQQPVHRLHFLDGMRGWASLMVLVWHLFINGYLHAYPNDDLMLRILPFNGNVAVALFFLISGFSLAIAYVETHDRERLARMAASRYFRLAIPVLITCALVYVGMKTGAVPQPRPYIYGQFLLFEPSIPHLLKVSLYETFFAFRYDQAYVLPLWTMHYELLGSFLVFALLLVAQRSAWRWLLYGAAYLVALWFQPLMALFVAGLLAANLFHRAPHLSRRAQWALAPALLLAWLIPVVNQHGPGLLAMLGMTYFFAALVWIAPCRRFFENRVSRFLGHISFALYLVHAPLMHSFTSHLFYYLRDTRGMDEGTVAFVAAAATFVLSILLAIPFTRVDAFGVRASRAIGKKIVHVCKSLAMLAPTMRV